MGSLAPRVRSRWVGVAAGSFLFLFTLSLYISIGIKNTGYVTYSRTISV